MSGFRQQMNSLRDRAALLAQHFDNPNVRPLLVRRRVGVGEYRYLQIMPYPAISYRNPRSEPLDGLRNIEGFAEEFEVKGISARFRLMQLVGDRLDYLVDGVMQFGKLVKAGIPCEYVSHQENYTTWTLQLKRKHGERSLS